MTDQLYREEFMEIYKANTNFGHLDSPTLVGDKSNSICGDKMVLELKLSGDKVTDARFNGIACAVSKTSASIVTEYLKGKTITELKDLSEEKILELIKFNLTSGRKQCALLCYYALQEALSTYDTKK